MNSSRFFLGRWVLVLFVACAEVKGEPIAAIPVVEAPPQCESFDRDLGIVLGDAKLVDDAEGFAVAGLEKLPDAGSRGALLLLDGAGRPRGPTVSFDAALPLSLGYHSASRGYGVAFLRNGLFFNRFGPQGALLDAAEVPLSQSVSSAWGLTLSSSDDGWGIVGRTIGSFPACFSLAVDGTSVRSAYPSVSNQGLDGVVLDGICWLALTSGPRFQTELASLQLTGDAGQPLVRRAPLGADSALGMPRVCAAQRAQFIAWGEASADGGLSELFAAAHADGVLASAPVSLGAFIRVADRSAEIDCDGQRAMIASFSTPRRIAVQRVTASGQRSLFAEIEQARPGESYGVAFADGGVAVLYGHAETHTHHLAIVCSP